MEYTVKSLCALVLLIQTISGQILGPVNAGLAANQLAYGAGLANNVLASDIAAANIGVANNIAAANAIGVANTIAAANGLAVANNIAANNVANLAAANGAAANNAVANSVAVANNIAANNAVANNIAANNAVANNIAANNAVANSIAANNIAGINNGFAFTPISGGTFSVTSSSPIAPSGVTLFSDNLLVEGPVAVAGKLPFLGSVALDGTLPAVGQGVVAYGCGDGNTGIISENLAPASPDITKVGLAGVPRPGLGLTAGCAGVL